MEKKAKKKLTLNRETLIQLREPNLQQAAGGYSLRCDTTYYASCVSCRAETCSDFC